MNTTDTTTFEAKARKTFLDLLAALSSPMDDGRIGRIESFLHPECKGFGTAAHEVFRSRNDWLKLFRQEFIQVPDGLDVTQKWSETRILEPATVELMAEIVFRIHLPSHDIVFDPTRVSALFDCSGAAPLLLHWHVSFPLGEDEEETFPGSREPRLYEEVSVLFADFAGFSQIAASVPPKKLVRELNDLFANFDAMVERHRLIKIKTVGDAYMAIAGMDARQEANHALQAVEAGLDFLTYLEKRNSTSALKWPLRIGVHSGQVIGGVIGRDKRQFDVWGDTVNIASRLQSTGEAGKLNVSAYAYELVKDRYPGEYRGKITAKGKGDIDMYFLSRALRPDSAGG